MKSTLVNYLILFNAVINLLHPTMNYWITADNVLTFASESHCEEIVFIENSAVFFQL